MKKNEEKRMPRHRHHHQRTINTTTIVININSHHMKRLEDCYTEWNFSYMCILYILTYMSLYATICVKMVWKISVYAIMRFTAHHSLLTCRRIHMFRTYIHFFHFIHFHIRKKNSNNIFKKKLKVKEKHSLVEGSTRNQDTKKANHRTRTNVPSTS